MNRLMLLLGTVCLLGAGAVRADSIWQRRNFFSAFLFVDTRARRIGDLVTIVVSENTGIDNKDQRDMSKATATGATLKTKGEIDGTSSTAVRTAVANFDGLTTSQRNFSGKSAYAVAQQFLDRMTAQVVAVEPNGNLVIQAYRYRLVDHEVRLLKLMGVIRPIDIGAYNTIESQYISNFQIYYMGRGPQSNFSNQGWFSRLLNYAWPY